MKKQELKQIIKECLMEQIAISSEMTIKGAVMAIMDQVSANDRITKRDIMNALTNILQIIDKIEDGQYEDVDEVLSEIL